MSAALSTVSPTQTQAGPRHFLDLKDLDAATLRQILDVARSMKTMQQGRRFPLHPRLPLAGRMLGIILSKPSTRTRVSFEVGIRQLGGDAIILTPGEMQLGRGETIADTARVLSRFVDALVLRTGKTSSLLDLAKWSSVPVINGLTPSSHPVQILADILTFEEHRGPVKGRTFAWTGDGNNVLVSLIEGAVRFGFKLRAATPPDMRPPQDVLDWATREGGAVEWTADPREAVKGADCVVTDTWISMSDSEEEAATRMAKLEAYQVNPALMALAAPNALFMHCLPAHIGEEVTKDVFEGPQSVVFDEAENRLHAQKGVLAWAMGGADWLSFGKE
ncbi:ornithine carbamoyltransferase [Acetobacter tropicalis NRIC 0312]|uniref:Ornithine carbamoyltransferase n=1 Tax=Acetobacter tropicalis TaxID=104102 RepID=A0A511FIY5_9PROT|nr:ornithine carbamoyltransferase [Acetobacter tropicalis]KXV45509.1 ornithine carbamoyltransferase [Acetobacter tropicalis]GAL97436.1 ornithine carbamoyltransferase [Acetobacter tropicalis]GBR71587.1 ornithine carbamoyltransferase [Acetobacter tropicalis NRIC 0312]GEL49201.1 ornithine carbamoyltransferase [Acetobacter tropicalis]